MYSSNPNEFQKSPMPSASPTRPPATAYSQQPATGIRVTPPNYMYADHKPQVPAQFQTRTPGRWSTGLCGCYSDISNYCITCWCPCITFGQIAEIVDKGSTPCAVSGAFYCLIAHFTGCPCIYSFTYRSRMRQQYNLSEQPCGDCLVHFCCERCALRQEYRELKNRGFNMSIGWQGNVEKQNGGATIAPNVQGGMNR